MKALVKVLPVVALALSGCGGLGYDGLVTTRIDLEENDITGAMLAEEKPISSDDQPWAPFINQARGALGKEPREILVRRVTVQIDLTRSSNVGVLEDALKDDAVIYFKADSSGAIVDVAKVNDPEGSAQVELSNTGNDLAAIQDQLVRGSFKVGIRSATTKLRTDKFKLSLSIGLELTAR